MPDRHAYELTTSEGYRLLEDIRSFGDPLVVFTGGDPLKRPDLYALIRHSLALGLRTNVSPSATPLLTTSAIETFKQLGVARMAISLDGPDAVSHDSFRGVPGTFSRAMRALRDAQRIGLETQIQTTVTRRNLEQLPRIAGLVGDVGGKMWSVFFLVVTGRAVEQDDLTADEYEKTFEILYEISKNAAFAVKTTEGMHYRRYVAQRESGIRSGGGNNLNAQTVVRRSAGVSDGRGFVFVSHTGDIYPSGFLPLLAGNVRSASLVDIYRKSMLFRQLRDPGQREGKCGRCEYKKLCGGSRARAYALTGNYLAEDPRCVYQPG
jgi:radical SAM protein